jgi:hypothetical protein
VLGFVDKEMAWSNSLPTDQRPAASSSKAAVDGKLKHLMSLSRVCWQTGLSKLHEVPDVPSAPDPENRVPGRRGRLRFFSVPDLPKISIQRLQIITFYTAERIKDEAEVGATGSAIVTILSRCQNPTADTIENYNGHQKFFFQPPRASGGWFLCCQFMADCWRS